MEKLKISIIVPIYKVEQYIHKCLDSILRQSYQNLEVILVDDESPDECPLICDEYAKKDKRVRVIHKKNGGVASSRNKGLDLATGDYIGFVDGDDYIDEKMFEQLINVAIDRKADIVHCDFQMVDKEGNEINYKNRVFNSEKILSNYETLCEHVINYRVKVMLWNKLYKKEIFDGLRFNEEYVHEDEILFPEIISRSNKNVILKEKLYFYVHAPEGITKGEVTRNKIESKKYLMIYLEKFYLEKYPELMRHIYLSICFTCIGCIRDVERAEKIEDKFGYIEYFRKVYMSSYIKMQRYKFSFNIPVKKELFCLLMYIGLKLKRR